MLHILLSFRFDQKFSRFDRLFSRFFYLSSPFCGTEQQNDAQDFVMS